MSSPSPRAVESLDAWSGALIATRSADADELLPERVKRARQAMAEWRARPVRARSEILRQFIRLLTAERDAVAQLIARETGKPIGEAMAAEVMVMLDDAARCARRAPVLLRPERRWSRNPALWRKRTTIARVPLGVVAVVSPWNYPMMLAAGHILPALATGNAVIFKPSEYAPLSAERLVGLLHRAGVPEAVLQIAHGDGRVGDALVRSGVDQVCFTGSAAAGAQVARACGERMIPCSLELGGTDAAIVLDDAPLAHTARGLTWGRLMNAGQSCVAPKRILAMSGIHDALVAALRTEVSCAVLDGPDNGAASLGGLIRVSQAEQVGRQTDGSLAAGASEIATQVVAATGPSAVVPRLLIGIDDDMPAWSEEIFGPVLAIRRVTSVDEAITLANASLFGLSASVWSGDRARARAIASRLDAGSVVINDVVSVVGMVDVPHGGTKRSGYGRMHGDEALLECTRTHAVVDDIAPSWRNPWWFPYSSNQRDDLSRFVGLVHGASLTERLRGIGAAIRLLLGPR